MDRTSRSRLLGRALLIGISVVLIAGLATDAYFWRRNNHAARATNLASALARPADSPSAAATPAASAAPLPIPVMSLVADVAVRTLPVYGAPAVGRVLADVPDVNAVGQTEALLVTDASVPGWYEVEVPVKPNGSQGWVQGTGVTIRQDPDYIQVSQSGFRLQFYTAGVLEQTFTVAVGAPSTPTPYGSFYVWATETYGAPYTPGIFALSSFSPVLDNWPGGGRTGIHGWTDTSIMGTRASHGCVRVAPRDFAHLLNTVPLGTPVDILS